MKILVLGSRGFIGTNLINILKKNKSIKVFKDRDLSKKKVNLQSNNAWKRLDKYDVLINLANYTNVTESWNKPFKYIKNNLSINLNALEYCRINNCKYILVSSCLYKDLDKNFKKESDELNPQNPYHLSLYLNEKKCYYYNKLFGVKILILRLSNVYGYGQSQNFIISKILTQLVKFKKIIVFDLQPKRDFIFIDDVIQSILKGIHLKYKFNIFNIASNKSYSVEELLKFLKEICKFNFKVENKNIVRKNEIPDVKISISKAKKILNWKPSIDIKNGLKKYYIKLKNDYRN